MLEIVIVANNRSELGPLTSVIAALPEATVVGLPASWQTSKPEIVMAGALQWFTTEFRRASPKLILLLGDRYETLAAALAATFLRIPIAHIHGGETTTGAFDDAFRDSITRMAALHFVATGQAASRVAELQLCDDSLLGLRSNNIHLVGAPGLDGVQPQSAKRDKNTIVASYYPETRAPDYGLAGCTAMLEALAPDCSPVFFSSVNNDPGAEIIKAAIQRFIDNRPMSALWITPNTREQYLHLAEHAALVIGNSSAGVIEAPWIGIPSVNIGQRQNGRPQAPSVVQVYGGVENIQRAIAGCISWNGPWEPAYTGGAAVKIAEVVRGVIR